MSKPTDIELKTALVAAGTMKEHDKDPFYIAKSLLNHNFRLKYYEELLTAADRYMNHGLAEHERMKLLRCIEKIKEEETRISKSDSDSFGLE
ncbi:MAG: hypothetical protein DIZ80_11865 [endosymbiont of Galathealinum brachiosum]|uniref:Uncharacterized protein n=1 Tax=endosymbiont of Galathealinum brachiosum TaxID=2200906 RepID=A0A370DDM5_9GAMM|nr:MAG: hypothetical protein DIZ80_11865 [endosymbiont of Galathealinum brachiosum]